MITTQDNFHPMKGHVEDGCQVKMNCGDTWTIKSTMSGWEVRNSKGDLVAPATPSAWIVLNIIANS